MFTEASHTDLRNNQTFRDWGLLTYLLMGTH